MDNKKINLLNKKIDKLEKELLEKNTTINNLSEHLNKILNGKIWKLISIYFKIRDKISAIKSIDKMFVNFLFVDAPRIIKIIKKNNYQRIFIFSSKGLGWYIPLKQRSQHIAEILAQKNNLIFYATNSSIEKDKNIGTFKMIEKNIYLINLENTKIKNLLINIICKYTKKPVYFEFIQTDFSNTYQYIKNLIKKKINIIYHYMDEISEDIIPGIPKFVYERHKQILNNKKITIIVTADKLYNEVKKNRNDNVLLSCNAVNIEDWDKKITEIPKDMENIIKEKKIIIGYYGALARWIDYDLLEKVIRNKSNINFVFIGSNYDNSINKSKIKSLKNFHYLGEKPYKELINYSNFFDICILPFKINKTTQSVSPVKIFEYMAQKKPIISTNISECKKYKVCLIAKNNIDFENKIEFALIKRNDIDYINNLYLTATHNTWGKRVNDIISYIEQHEK